MTETSMIPTIEEREQQLAALRQAHADTVAAITAVERELEPAERAREQAQRVYNEAAAGVARAMAVMSPGDPSATWRQRSGRQEAAAEDVLREARGVFEQAEAELSQRLVVYNEANRRRGELLMHSRALAARIEAAEQELDKARQAEVPSRDLLGGIRARLGLGGPGLPAA